MEVQMLRLSHKVTGYFIGYLTGYRSHTNMQRMQEIRRNGHEKKSY